MSKKVDTRQTTQKEKNVQPKEVIIETSVPIQGGSSYDRAAEMKSIFTIFDRNGDGKISNTEVESLLKSLGRNFSQEEIDKLVQEIDKNGDGFLQLDEFSAYLDKIDIVPTNKLEEVVEAFKIFDLDGNGFISGKEFKTILTKFGGDFTPEEVDELFAEIDLDHDGNISYAEFIELWKYQ